VWAGVRPLIADPGGKPSDISRAHQIQNPEPGWWDVAERLERWERWSVGTARCGDAGRPWRRCCLRWRRAGSVGFCHPSLAGRRWSIIKSIREGHLRPAVDIEIGQRAATLCKLGNLSYLLGRKLAGDGTKPQVVGEKVEGYPRRKLVPTAQTTVVSAK